jgi:ribosomal protein L13
MSLFKPPAQICFRNSTISLRLGYTVILLQEALARISGMEATRKHWTSDLRSCTWSLYQTSFSKTAAQNCFWNCTISLLLGDRVILLQAAPLRISGMEATRKIWISDLRSCTWSQYQLSLFKPRAQICYLNCTISLRLGDTVFLLQAALACISGTKAARKIWTSDLRSCTWSQYQMSLFKTPSLNCFLNCNITLHLGETVFFVAGCTSRYLGNWGTYKKLEFRFAILHLITISNVLVQIPRSKLFLQLHYLSLFRRYSIFVAGCTGMYLGNKGS